MRSEEGDLSPGRMGAYTGTDEAGQGSEFVDDAADDDADVDATDAKAWFKAYERPD
jgi:hypothetical protein